MRKPPKQDRTPRVSYGEWVDFEKDNSWIVFGQLRYEAAAAID